MIDLERLLRVPYVDPGNGYDISFDGERAAILPCFVWSPDSKEIAFISDSSGHF